MSRIPELLVELVKSVVKGIRKQEMLINYLLSLRLSDSESYLYSKHVCLDNQYRVYSTSDKMFDGYTVIYSIHLLHKDLLSTYYMPSPVLDAFRGIKGSVQPSWRLF